MSKVASSETKIPTFFATQLLLLLDDRTHLLGWRLSTKCTKGLLRRRRNILLRRRVDTTAITRVTPTSVLRRSRSSKLFFGHVEK